MPNRDCGDIPRGAHIGHSREAINAKRPAITAAPCYDPERPRMRFRSANLGNDPRHPWAGKAIVDHQ